MEKELIIKLMEIREELEIPQEDFIKIIALAKRHRDKSKIVISDEMLFNIISDALLGIDSEVVDNKGSVFYDPLIKKRKTPEESILRAIRNLDY